MTGNNTEVGNNMDVGCSSNSTNATITTKHGKCWDHIFAWKNDKGIYSVYFNKKKNYAYSVVNRGCVLLDLSYMLVSNKFSVTFNRSTLLRE